MSESDLVHFILPNRFGAVCDRAASQLSANPADVTCEICKGVAADVLVAKRHVWEAVSFATKLAHDGARDMAAGILYAVATSAYDPRAEAAIRALGEALSAKR